MNKIKIESDKPVVVIPMDEYNELMEDLHDLSVIAERKDEESVSFEDLKRSLNE
jgi:PHD/YefM family antitoxin component YafN of YafNO toxin-antitoxin module